MRWLIELNRMPMWGSAAGILLGFALASLARLSARVAYRRFTSWYVRRKMRSLIVDLRRDMAKRRSVAVACDNGISEHEHVHRPGFYDSQYTEPDPRFDRKP